MTATPKLLAAAADLANASALLYTSPVAGKGTWLDKATALNHSGAARTVTFNHVPAAGAAANSNLLVSAKSIADKATDTLPELVGKFIPAGASLYGFADTAASVAFELNGRELT
jgi:hypothetical protein